MAEPIRIANCSGFFGDRLSAAREMVEGGPIHVLTGDWLAELTMLILARTRAKLEKTLNAAKSALHDGTERVKTTARQAADTTDQYVHANPWSAVGIAAAAGAAIAVLLSTRIQR